MTRTRRTALRPLSAGTTSKTPHRVCIVAVVPVDALGDPGLLDSFCLDASDVRQRPKAADTARIGPRRRGPGNFRMPGKVDADAG